MSRVLVVSDTQSPFQHPKALQFLETMAIKYKCNRFVHIGDPVDNKFLKFMSVNDPDSASRQHELALKFMRELYELFPDVFVCNCNHVVDRLEFKAELGQIPSFMLRTPKEYLEAPSGWHWGDFHIIDGVRYEHGHRFSGNRPHLAAVNANFMSTVIGHHPNLGVEYISRNGKQYFGAASGALVCDYNHKRMGYGMRYAKRYPNGMPIGTVVVIDGEQCYVERL